MGRKEPQGHGTAGIEVWRGYFGKVPVNGDFVGRGLPRAVEDALDAWLRAAMRASQSDLGRDWLDAFLVTPVWQFALPPGAAGPVSVLGVMMPSVDRVGRYFPLVIATALPIPLISALEMIDGTGFYEEARALALSTLDPDLTMARFDQAVAALPAPDVQQVAEAAADLRSADQTTVWWIPRQEPIWSDGLPAPNAYAKTFMLPTNASGANTPPAPAAQDAAPHPTHDDDGLAADAPTLETATPAPSDPTPMPPALLSPGGRAALELSAAQRVPLAALDPVYPPPLTLDIASASLKGARSQVLSDVVTVAPDGQAFGLLCGLGSDPSLPKALHSVAPMLEEIAHPFAMSDLIAEAKGKLGQANAMLNARATAQGQACAASVVMLLIQAQRHAVLWAGSARAFLLRDGALLPLTRPHLDRRLHNIVTRALGAGPNLSPDTAIGQVRADDRFLLVSPGLYEALGPQEMGETLLTAANPDAAVAQLTQNALIAGAALDASALTVFAASQKGRS